MVRFLLIAPRSDSEASFASVVASGSLSVTRVAAVGIATVAAFAPPEVETLLHDEALDPVDFDAEVDFVGISANVSQARRAIELAAGFRARGRTVIIGGPHITLDPDAFEGACDVAVTGEFEEIAAGFYADMLNGQLQPQYSGGRPDLSRSPVPAWEKYPNERALIGVAQTSRGCPFECNFCDVIQYLGRKQRHKTNEQVIAEVQRLYDLGYNRIALADDNLTVYRKRATSLLEALAAWNGTDGRDYVNFATQVSIDVARDENILRLCAEAGVSDLFVGIESVNEESLKGANKRQNLHTDMVAQVRRIVSYGLRVEATLMVGFDADSKRIFEQQYDFGMSLPVGPFYVSALMAPKATPFYDDMLAAGRIAADDVQRHSPGTGFITNILPAQMTREELSIGTRWLISRLFHPDAFWIRFQHVAEYLGRNPLRDRGTGKLYNPPERALTGRLVGRMIRQLARQDERVAAVLRKASVLMRNRPDIGDGLGEVLSSWIVALHTHREKGAYDPGLALLDRPPLAPPGSAERVPTFSRALDTAA